MDNSRNRQSDNLGVNKIGKNIKKSPLHQPNFANNANNRQQSRPQVYNISKNDFRSIVQQLTSSSQEPLPRPPQNPPKPQSMRLQKIRPPPLTPINPPLIPLPVPAPAMVPPPVPYNNSFLGPGPPGQFGQPSSTIAAPVGPRDSAWTNTVESPLSAYVRYLQYSMTDPTPRGNQAQPSLQQPRPPLPGQIQPQPLSSGLLPNPPIPPFPSPRTNCPNLPAPQMNGPALLPSPTSLFLLPSPTSYLNFLSPQSQYPLLSPRIKFPPQTPNFAFSPMAQFGILGPGPQPPLSPGPFFPLSPSGFFPFSSPRWRDQ